MSDDNKDFHELLDALMSFHYSRPKIRPKRDKKNTDDESRRGGPGSQDDDWLTGWKEISNYTSLGVTTMKRAYRRGEFKVKKISMGRNSYVTVKKLSMDEWRDSRDEWKHPEWKTV